MFFLSRIFFPTHASNKNGQKKWKILIYYIFFQGCLPKLHHIIVKSYNKNKIQFLPFLHLIEKLFLCISLPLFLQYLIFYKCKYILLGLVFKFLLILLPITPLASMEQAIKNVLIIRPDFIPMSSQCCPDVVLIPMLSRCRADPYVVPMSS